jgi:hypothetical protein
MPDTWIALNLTERGLLESVARVIILNGPIPDDERIVARRVGADIEEVRGAWPAVKRLLQPDADGRLVHAETLAAIAEAEAATEKNIRQRSEAGKHSAEARLKKKNSTRNKKKK